MLATLTSSSKNMWVRAFVITFHTPKYSIWAESDEKFLQNVLPAYFSTFPNLRLGSIIFKSTFSHTRVLYLGDWPLNISFNTRSDWLGRPKSSFGEHKFHYIFRGVRPQMLGNLWYCYLLFPSTFSYHIRQTAERAPFSIAAMDRCRLSCEMVI